MHTEQEHLGGRLTFELMMWLEHDVFPDVRMLHGSMVEYLLSRPMEAALQT